MSEDREVIAQIIKDVTVKWGGPSMAEFADTPPIRKHYATADAILREFEVTPHAEAANCHLCVGAGGHEGFDGEWVECSCQRPTQGEASVIAIDDAIAAFEGYPGDMIERSSRAWRRERMRAALRAASEAGGA